MSLFRVNTEHLAAALGHFLSLRMNFRSQLLIVNQDFGSCAAPRTMAAKL